MQNILDRLEVRFSNVTKYISHKEYHSGLETKFGWLNAVVFSVYCTVYKYIFLSIKLNWCCLIKCSTIINFHVPTFLIILLHNVASWQTEKRITFLSILIHFFKGIFDKDSMQLEFLYKLYLGK